MPNPSRPSRRTFLASAAAVPLTTLPVLGHALQASRRPQRVCVVLLDGFGCDYYETSTLPNLKAWAKTGFYKRIRAVMPTVTNTNISGYCCGVHADEHGITGNSYWDTDSDQERFMSDGNL